MITVRFSGPFRSLFGVSDVTVDAASVDKALEHLIVLNPDFGKKVFKEGSLNKFVNIYLNDEDIRHSGGLQTALKDGDELNILSAIAGG